MTNNRQRSHDEPPITNRIRWFYPVLTGLVCLGLLAPAYGQTVNLQFNASAPVGNPSSVSSCSAFTFGMNYGVVSAVTAAQGAKITLPLKGFTYNSIVPNPDVASSLVQGTSPNDTLVVTMINPLTAGKSGTVTVLLQFPCGTTCNGQKYLVRLSPTNGSLVNFLPLTTPVMSVTVAMGATIRLYGTSGVRSTIPNGLPATTFTPTSTTVGSNTVLTWTNISIFYRGGSLGIRTFELDLSAFPTVVTPPTLSLTNNGPLTCAKASVQLTAGGSGVTYRWDGPASFSATSATATTGQPGIYTVVTTGATSCTTVATTTVARDNTLPVVTALPTACNPTTNQYTVSGTITLSQPGGGPLVVTDGASSLTLTVSASQTSIAYSLTGLTSDVGSHTVTAGFATTVCAPAAVTYAAPASCSCVVSVTFTAGACQFNQTNSTTTDDYHRPTLRATNTVPGTTGRYEVVLNANANGTGGPVLNPGGTAHGQSVVVGTPGQFNDDTTSYNLTIRDSNTPGCRTTLATPAVASCSSCLPLLCPPVTVVRRVKP